jgi:hypothetical protein
MTVTRTVRLLVDEACELMEHMSDEELLQCQLAHRPIDDAGKIVWKLIDHEFERRQQSSWSEA